MSHQRKAECRYCLETDTIDNLIAPCICKGSFQYVHNECCMKWYQSQPVLGLQCSACKTQLAKAYPHAVEDFPTATFRDTIGLEHPFRMVLLGHSLYILGAFGFGELTYEIKISLYILYQWFFHLFYLFFFVKCVQKVQNQVAYALEWCKPSRLGLLVLHGWILYTIPSTFMIGGLASDLFIFVYFYEHYSIILSMNHQNEFIFVNYHLE